MTQPQAREKIRVGVVGLWRGRTFANDDELLGLQLVAVCDSDGDRLRKFAAEHPGVTTYEDVDAFLAHDMDAVVLANYFHQHAPLAIKALRAGKHVMSETQACKTLQEGVALARTVEETGLIYMLAENYPYFAAVQEMRRLYQDGVAGTVKYAEGEYTHPMPEKEHLRIAPGLNHWRNHLPTTYYCTHALAPLMYITDTMPVDVRAMIIQADEGSWPRSRVAVSDPASVIVCRMDNGAVFRILMGGLAGHRNYYRVHGFKGRLEKSGSDEVTVTRNAWDLAPGEHEVETFKARFHEHAQLADRAGHGGGDFWTRHEFAEAIRERRQPYLDVYRGIAMSVVGILAYRSAHQESSGIVVPDFSDEKSRQPYENDDWSPWPEDHRPGQPWPSIRGQVVLSDEAVAYARRVWADEDAVE